MILLIWKKRKTIISHVTLCAEKRRSKSLLTTVEKVFVIRGSVKSSFRPFFGHAPLMPEGATPPGTGTSFPARVGHVRLWKPRVGPRKTMIICGLIHFASNLIKYLLVSIMTRDGDFYRWLLMSVTIMGRSPVNKGATFSIFRHLSRYGFSDLTGLINITWIEESSALGSIWHEEHATGFHPRIMHTPPWLPVEIIFDLTKNWADKYCIKLSFSCIRRGNRIANERMRGWADRVD